MAGAVTVGRIGVTRKGAVTVLKVATDGLAQPKLSLAGAPRNQALIEVPGSSRSTMAPLKVRSGVLMGIHFASEAGDLRILADLKTGATVSLGAVTDRGFEVLLAPSAASSARKEEPSATEGDVSALNPASAAYTYRIVDLALGGDDEQGELVISSDGPANYKSSLKEDGKLLSLVFRNSSLAWSGDGAKLSDRSLSGVNVRQLNEGGESVVKVDVRLREKLAYNLRRDQNQLVLRFPRPEKEVAAPRRGDLRALVSVDVEDADIVGVLKALCQQAGFEYQFTKDILGKTPPDSLVTLRVKQRPFDEVTNTILAQVNGNYVQEGNYLYIGSAGEIAEKKKRMPSVERFYEPKYLTPAQLLALVNAHFSRDPLLKGVAFTDPTNSARFMLVGTAQDVADRIVAGRTSDKR